MLLPSPIYLQTKVVIPRPKTDKNDNTNDLNLLSTALVYEYCLIAAYKGLEGFLGKKERYRLHHEEHRDAIVAGIKRLGGKVIEAEKGLNIEKLAKQFSLPVPKNEDEAIFFLSSFEKLGADIHYSLIPAFKNRDLVKYLVLIMADEAMHEAAWALYKGKDSFSVPTDIYQLETAWQKSESRDAALINIILPTENITIAVYSNLVTKLQGESLKFVSRFLKEHEQFRDELVKRLGSYGLLTKPEEPVDITKIAREHAVGSLSNQTDILRFVIEREAVSIAACTSLLPRASEASLMKLLGLTVTKNARRTATLRHMLKEEPVPRAFLV